ncbi:PH domain-containing protein [Propionibacteriaceae bacterium G57]|uniref:PH domain-containing protein n=1 Tax=Aestuariimicrobium sp. G57 TaxID=3418485 RepID=UPI003DA789E7
MMRRPQHPGDPSLRLGPQLAWLGDYPATRAGSTHVKLMWVSAALGLVPLGLALYLLRLARELGNDMLMVMCVGLVVLSVAVILLALVGIRQTTRASVAVHVDGLQVRQPWFVDRTTPWAEVAAVKAPEAAMTGRRFVLALHSGRHLVVLRLGQPPQRAGDGSWVPHPDVQFVLTAFADWRRRQQPFS